MMEARRECKAAKAEAEKAKSTKESLASLTIEFEEAKRELSSARVKICEGEAAREVAEEEGRTRAMLAEERLRSAVANMERAEAEYDRVKSDLERWKEQTVLSQSRAKDLEESLRLATESGKEIQSSLIAQRDAIEAKHAAQVASLMSHISNLKETKESGAEHERLYRSVMGQLCRVEAGQ
jgi:chromosome segregation ATPase